MSVLPTISIIPDALLAEYLKDKLTTKPNYGYDTETSSDEAFNRWKVSQALDSKNRKDNNAKVKREYKL